MKPFDMLHTPLRGTNLIEASAGTGKTYTIVGIFLRLLLEQRLAIDQILVVTFTIAATDELKERIRQKIQEAADAFQKKVSEDPFIQYLISNSLRPEIDGQLLKNALFDFDQASIFTIHGFCQRILLEHAFETGNPFDTELVTDKGEMVQAVSEDYWRKQLYDLPTELIQYILTRIKTPVYFRKLLEISHNPETKIIPRVDAPKLTCLELFRSQIAKVRRIWQREKSTITALLKDPALNGTIYGSLKPEKQQRDNDASPKPSKREIKILSMAMEMDAFMGPDSSGFPLFKDFEKFTTGKIEASVRKNHVPPSHDFFHACQGLYDIGKKLEGEMEAYLLYVKVGLFQYAISELTAGKKRLNIHFFDDLLLQVKKTLQSDESSLFSDKIRRQYRAALIDEFQDTDPIQYEIFDRIFSSENSLLFLIGDPKQAIYGFRGADLFSYLKAAKHVREKYSLTENWRSSPKLISAINALFSRRPDAFIFDDIQFTPGVPGNKDMPGQGHTETVKTPFMLWMLEDNGQPAVSKADAVERIIKAVADEIRRLISGTKASGDEPDTPAIHPGDIAVLVRTNRQAQLMNTSLLKVGVPSILYYTGNVFDSHEALELERVISGIAEPGDVRSFRLAMATEMLGGSAEMLDSSEAASLWWIRRHSDFRMYHKIWQSSGFMPMFRLLLARENARQRLLSFHDGERRVTNMLHLSEILHRASEEKNLGISDLVKWLSEQRTQRKAEQEEHQLRLESDENAVKIVTIHKSKGLEYPVVFCPFGWESPFVNDDVLIFHDPDENDKLTLSLAANPDPDHLALASKEQLAENLRLLYVALTRAEKQCFLVWGNIRGAENSGIAYLLSGSTASDTKDRDTGSNKKMAQKPVEMHSEDLSQLTADAEGSITVRPLPIDLTNDVLKLPDDTMDRDAIEPLACYRFSGDIDRNWKIISYSSLAATKPDEDESPDYDVISPYPLEPIVSNASPESLESHKDIFSFPGGSRSGRFFHDIFEHLDFTDVGSSGVDQLVGDKLHAYGFTDDWQPVIVKMVENVLSTSLLNHPADFTLRKISTEQRMNEMEFYFPIHPVSPQRLRHIFTRYGGHQIPGHFPDRLGDLTFTPVNGYMKGYVDLIFSFQNRFYLVDWKSNVLGHDPHAYHIDQLPDIMAEAYYILQYHLYALALHQYLRLKHPEYRYDVDFGGVLYLFIRGMDPDLGPEYGIYFDRPKIELIDALGGSLIPGY